MPTLIERFTAPASPAALLQAVHPDLDIGLPGSTITGTVVGVTHTTGGHELRIRVPLRSGRALPGTRMSVAVDIDGVRHSTWAEVLHSAPGSAPGPHRTASGGVLRRLDPFGGALIGLLIDAEAAGSASALLRSPECIGERVLLDPSPAADGSVGCPIESPTPPAQDVASTTITEPATGRPPVTGCTPHTVAGGDERRRVVFAASAAAGAAEDGDTLLEVAESAGLHPLTGCRRGVCHRCATELIGGTTVNTRDGTIGGPGDTVRICVSRPVTDVEVAL